MSVDRATTLLGEHGEGLFHYTRLETAIEKILPTLTLRMNPFSRMRDPRESKAWAVSATGFVGDLTGDELDGAWARGQHRMNEAKDRFKLLALTMDDPETPDPYGRGWARARLWDRYADGGRGVCLAFDRADLIRMVTAELEDLGLEPRCGPVEYKDGRLFEEIHFDIVALATDLEGTVRRQLSEHLDALFLRKLTDWRSEHEFRFIVETDDAEPVDVNIRGALRAVCLGPDTPAEYFPAVAELCRPSGIRVAKLVWWNSDPLVAGIALDLTAERSSNPIRA